MRKILVLIFVMFLSANAYAETLEIWVHMKVTEGTGMWDWWPDLNGCGSSKALKNCRKFQAPVPKLGGVEAITGGYLVHAQLDKVEISYKADSTATTWTTFNRNGNNYLFGPDEYLHIDACPPYPGLVGIEVSISGILTDENGNFVVFIPSGVNP